MQQEHQNTNSPLLSILVWQLLPISSPTHPQRHQCGLRTHLGTSNRRVKLAKVSYQLIRWIWNNWPKAYRVLSINEGRKTMGLSSSYVKTCPRHLTVALLKRSRHNVLFICKIFLPAFIKLPLWTSLFILNMKPTSRNDNDCFVHKGKFQNVECTTAQIPSPSTDPTHAKCGALS